MNKNATNIFQIVENSPNEMFIIDYETNKYLFANDGACKTLGYSQDELLQLNIFNTNPFLLEKNFNYLKDMCSDDKIMQNRSIQKKKDGSTYPVQVKMHTCEYNDKKAIMIFNNDISEIMELKQKYKKQAEILDHIHDSIISTDLDGKILSYNKGSEVLLGFTKDEAIGKNILDIYSLDNESDLKSLANILKKRNEYDMEAYLTRKDGTKIICDIYLSAIKDENGELSGMVGYSLDVTDKKEAQKLIEIQADKLQHQAYHDNLTDLPNRALFKDRLSQAIKTSSRNNEKFALLFIDLDKFKQINDSLGHNVGDQVLIEASKRLSDSIRDEDTLARIGGDEFTIIVRNLKNKDSTSIVANKIIKTMRAPIQINNQDLYISASVGISIFPDDAEYEHNLIKFSDEAMYRAKKHRNTFEFYNN